MTRQRYNIAYVPVRDEIQSILQRYAQVLYSDHYDDYILGPQALAHVTLCQFIADSDADAQRAFDDYAAPAEFNITIARGQIRPGTLVNAGFFIAEFDVVKDPELMTLQKSCFDFLQHRALDPRTPWDRYAPHFTLARVRGDDLPVPDASIVIDHMPLRMRACVAQSSENGMLRADCLTRREG